MRLLGGVRDRSVHHGAAEALSARWRSAGRAQNELGAACVVPGSYQVEHVAYLQEDSATRRFVLAKARRYSIPELAQAMADLGWHMVEHAPSGDDKRAPISQLLFERR